MTKILKQNWNYLNSSYNSYVIACTSGVIAVV